MVPTRVGVSSRRATASRRCWSEARRAAGGHRPAAGSVPATAAAGGPDGLVRASRSWFAAARFHPGKAAQAGPPSFHGRRTGGQSSARSTLPPAIPGCGGKCSSRLAVEQARQPVLLIGRGFTERVGSVPPARCPCASADSGPFTLAVATRRRHAGRRPAPHRRSSCDPGRHSYVARNSIEQKSGEPRRPETTARPGRPATNNAPNPADATKSPRSRRRRPPSPGRSKNSTKRGGAELRQPAGTFSSPPPERDSKTSGRPRERTSESGRRRRPVR